MLYKLNLVVLAVFVTMITGCSGAPKSIIGNAISQQYIPAKSGRETLDTFDIKNQYTRTISDEEVNVYEYSAKFLPSENLKKADQASANSGNVSDWQGRPIVWKNRYPVYQVTGTIYIVKRGSEWYNLSDTLSEHYRETRLGDVCGDDNHACKDDSDGNPTASSASSVASINAADLAVDHAGNPISSAPGQSAKPAVAAPPTLVETLPFVGTKEFNFDGGVLTVQRITIKSDGTATLKEIHSDFGENQKFVVSYKGKFTNLIQLKDGTGLLFKDGKVFRLLNGQQDTSCSDVQSGKDNVPCVSELDSL